MDLLCEPIMASTIDEKLIADLSVDDIHVDHETIELAKYGDPMAICNVGEGYYREREYEKARLWWNIAATLSYGRAQLELGCLFFNGEGVAENIDLAEYWFLEALNNGVIDAIQHIGIVHSRRGDYVKAVECFKRSAHNGNAAGQHSLGLCYMNGEGVSQDDKMAIEWFRLSANQGCREAQYDIAYMLENGLGVNTDKFEALDWYDKSYSNGFEIAMDRIRYLNGEGFFNCSAEKIRLLLDYFPLE